MNIRPKNTILFALTGVKFSLNNLGGANWRQQVFNNYRLHLLDLLTKYGEALDYGQWLNEMLSRHANIYNLAGGEKGNWLNIAYKNDLVGQYQQDYRGGLGNNGLYKRYGSVAINPNDRYDFNQTGIKTNQSTRYDIANPPSRTSGDYSREGYNYKVDNLYSAITDDRRLLGRYGDWDETSEDFKQWQKELNDRGWETFLDKDNYYKLRRIGETTPTPENPTLPNNPSQTTINGIPVGLKVDKEPFLNKLLQGVNKVAPDLLDALRFAGNMHNNERVYNELNKAIIPNLLLSYHTYRQVFGDEATKQAYYRRAAQGQTLAARPFTSDADRLMAYQMEAKRIGDELRAQGDLADNQRIRETSAESAAHADANTLRDTEVANSNLTELIKARAARHQLAALKHSADWTNWDLYLLGWLSKLLQKKAKEEALNDLLITLDLQEDLLNDGILLDLKTKREKSYYDYANAKTNEERDRLKKIFEEDNTNYQKYYIQKLREALHRKYQVPVAKSGTKVTKKNEANKFLYKTSKDIVEHFRRMSKMTDDSRIRTLPKPIKLSSHPKKFLLGGVAPFTIYRPLGAGADTTVTTQTGNTSSLSSSSTKKSEAEKDKLDMIKELFKAIQGQGLPIDVSQVYLEISQVINRAKAFGEDLSTDDIASMYLNSMLKINNLKYSKDVFDKAKAQATANDALNEFAVTTGGKLVLLDADSGKISIGTFLDIENSNGKLNPLTNDQLLNLRAYSPLLALMNGDELMQIVNNGVGMNKIAALIKSMASTLGSTEKKIEGISEVENRKIKKGLLILAGTDGTPDGFYKVTRDEKNSTENVKAALNYIYNMLPNNYKAILEIHSGGKDNSKALIMSMLASLTSDYYKEDITPLTGKASDKDKNSEEKIKSNPLMQMIQGEGGVPRTWDLITRDSNVKMSVDGMYYSLIPKVKDDTSLDVMLSESGFAGILDSKLGITFGDQHISSDQLKDVMYSNSGGMIVTLPCKMVNGHKEINLGVKLTYEEAVQAVESKGLTRNSLEYNKALGEELKNKGLSSLLDNNGMPDRNKFGQFLVVEAYTTTKLKNLDTSSQYIEKVNNPSDELELRLIRALSTNTKKDDYSLDINYLLWGDDVYRGTVFIPLTNNLNAAINAWGDSVKVEDARELENKFLNFNKASTMKSSNSDVLL